jgi:hypothetical protein
MAVKEIEPIDNHIELAIDRLPQQYKDASAKYNPTYSEESLSGWESFLHSFVAPAQDMENIMIDMLNERGLTTAEGVNLDRIGQIVGIDRQGLPDDEYQIQLIGQIAANNSNTTGDDLLGITAILIGVNVPKIVQIRELFPAKFEIEYKADQTFTVDSSNNSFIVTTDVGGGSTPIPFTIPAGDYFPFELDKLLQDSFLTATGAPLIVSFNANRTYTINVASTPLPDPALDMDTAGPLYGFLVSEVITTDATGAAVEGPDIDPNALDDALEAAKAAGVGFQILQTQFGNVFGFDNDPSVLGYAALLSPGTYPENYYDTYVFPQVTTEPIGFAFYAGDQGGDYQLRIQMLLPDAETFFNEVLATGERNFSIVDLNGVEWTFLGTFEASFAVLSQASIPVAYDIALEFEGLNASGTIYKDQQPTDGATFFAEFATITVSDEATFLLYNPTGLIVRDSDVVSEDVLIGGGTYATII